MQLASKGLGASLHAASAGARSKAAATAQPHLPPGLNISNARSIHIPIPRSTGIPHIPTPIPVSSSRPSPNSLTNLAGRVYQGARTVFTGFLKEIAKPGLEHANAATRGLHGGAFGANAAVRSASIQERLSLPARHALNIRAGGQFIPRPSPVPRSTLQVGLGTARNFSTTRPLFQQVIQNTPIAARTTYKADWDVKKRAHAKAAAKKNLKEQEKKENIRPRALKVENSKTISADLDRYFPVAVSETPKVKTILLIPLAPTPTTRVPLQAESEPVLLPYAALGGILESYHIHKLRVQSLFARLDVARVWDRGAVITTHGDPLGTCTILRIEFTGWCVESVREVLGDAGRTWCRLIEVHEDDGQSDTDSVSSPMTDNLDSSDHSPRDIDPTSSFIIPTLDFSSSFVNADRAPSTVPTYSYPPSPALSDDSDPLSSFSLSPTVSELDLDSEEHVHSSSASPDGYLSDDGCFSSFDAIEVNSRLGFSSDFIARSQVS